jgi:hypothetical protein
MDMKNASRSLLVAAMLLALALPVAAQAPGKPAGLQPIPEPPPPAGLELDPSLEPQVTILKRGTDTVEEYRIGGKLYMIKVTPAHGIPYYMVDREGYGTFTRDDTYVGNNIRPPMWLIFSF